MFFDGLGEAIRYASDLGGDVWITDRVNMPYIYVLFYERIPPDDFIADVDYVNPDGAFRQVRSMGRWHFSSSPPEGAVYVVSEAEGTAGKTAAKFDGYVVEIN